MSIITYSVAQKNFEGIRDGKKAIVILRKNNENAVLLSEEEYNKTGSDIPLSALLNVSRSCSCSAK